MLSATPLLRHTNANEIRVVVLCEIEHNKGRPRERPQNPKG